MAAVEQGQFGTSRTAHDEIYQKLRKRMLEGGFMPGEVISIRHIAREYDISPMPAREAMRRLIAEGALQFADRRKIIVPKVDHKRIRDILTARCTLERELAERAFDSIDAADIGALHRIDEGINRAIMEGDVNSYMKGNFEFHFLIYQRADSEVLISLVEMLWLQFGPSMRFVFSRWGTSAVAEDHHRQALEALDNRDRSGFVAAIEADIHQGMGFLKDS